jgi:hypothetical protein
MISTSVRVSPVKHASQSPANEDRQLGAPLLIGFAKCACGFGSDFDRNRLSGHGWSPSLIDNPYHRRHSASHTDFSSRWPWHPAAYAMIDNIHAIPVRRRLVERRADWKWSNTRWYAGMTPIQIEMDRSLPPRTIIGPDNTLGGTP